MYLFGFIFITDWRKQEVAGTELSIPLVPLSYTSVLFHRHNGTFRIDPVFSSQFMCLCSVIITGTSRQHSYNFQQASVWVTDSCFNNSISLLLRARWKNKYIVVFGDGGFWLSLLPLNFFWVGQLEICLGSGITRSLIATLRGPQLLRKLNSRVSSRIGKGVFLSLDTQLSKLGARLCIWATLTLNRVGRWWVNQQCSALLRLRWAGGSVTSRGYWISSPGSKSFPDG